MNIFITIGIVWLMLQCISNRLLYTKFILKDKTSIVGQYIGLLLEVGFSIWLIVFVNTKLMM